MKKRSLILSFVLAGTLLLNGCKKSEDESKFCVTCNAVVKMTSEAMPDEPIVEEVTTEQCGITEKSLKEFLAIGNSTSTITTNGVKITTKTVTTCKKK